MKRTGMASVLVLVAGASTNKLKADGTLESPNSGSEREKKFRDRQIDHYKWRMICTSAPKDLNKKEEMHLDLCKFTLSVTRGADRKAPSESDELNINDWTPLSGEQPLKTYLRFYVNAQARGEGDATMHSVGDDWDMGWTPSPDVTMKLTKETDQTDPYYKTESGKPKMVDPTIEVESPTDVTKRDAAIDNVQYNAYAWGNGTVILTGLWTEYGWNWRLDYVSKAYDSLTITFVAGTQGAHLEIKEKDNPSVTVTPVFGISLNATWGIGIIQSIRTETLRKEWSWIDEEKWKEIPNSYEEGTYGDWMPAGTS